MTGSIETWPDQARSTPPSDLAVVASGYYAMAEAWALDREFERELEAGLNHHIGDEHISPTDSHGPLDGHSTGPSEERQSDSGEFPDLWQIGRDDEDIPRWLLQAQRLEQALAYVLSKVLPGRDRLESSASDLPLVHALLSSAGPLPRPIVNEDCAAGNGPGAGGSA